MGQFQEKDVIRILIKISNQCDFQFLNADRKLKKLTHALKKKKKTQTTKKSTSILGRHPRRQEKKKQAIASK